MKGKNISQLAIMCQTPMEFGKPPVTFSIEGISFPNMLREFLSSCPYCGGQNMGDYPCTLDKKKCRYASWA